MIHALRLAQLVLPGLLLLATLALFFQLRKLRSDHGDLSWRVTLDEDQHGVSLVNLSVGVIQFMPNGYSITFDSIAYEPTGVRLVGHLGNPRALNLSTLTLNFEVRHPEWKFRKVYDRQGSVGLWLNDTLTVGKAQVAVGDVRAGAQTPFTVTVPNVKQSSENYEIRVSFSGERYQYLQ